MRIEVFKNFIWIAGLSTAFTVAASVSSAQNPPVVNPQEAARQERIRAEAARRDIEVRLARLRSLGDRSSSDIFTPRQISADVADLYRGPTKDELKSLAALPEDYARFEPFLSKKGTGLVRLVMDADCGDGTMTVSVTAACVKYSMPGNGSSFSFRETGYRMRRLADIQYWDGNFIAPGILQHSFLSAIGDIPLEGVTLSTSGLAPLISFVPVRTMEDAALAKQQIHEGWQAGGFYYSDHVRAVESMTYVMRSVAYRGRVDRAIGGYPYNELNFDRRLDITIAFRLVRMHDDGSVTILWKELARQDSPKLAPMAAVRRTE